MDDYIDLRFYLPTLEELYNLDRWQAFFRFLEEAGNFVIRSGETEARLSPPSLCSL